MCESVGFDYEKIIDIYKKNNNNKTISMSCLITKRTREKRNITRQRKP